MAFLISMSNILMVRHWNRLPRAWFKRCVDVALGGMMDLAVPG